MTLQAAAFNEGRSEQTKGENELGETKWMWEIPKLNQSFTVLKPTLNTLVRDILLQLA